MPTRTCSLHHAMIFDRGGMTPLGEVKRLSKVEWNRDRDGVSEADITIDGFRNCGIQRRVTNKASEKRHELVIFRDKERVWEGPIYRISDLGSRIEINARDVGSYLFETPVTKDYDNRKNVIAMTTRIANIIAYELSNSRVGRKVGGGTITVPGWETLSPPANILPFLDVRNFPNEAKSAAYTRAFSTTVGLLLANAARQGGIDYTTVGRRIVLWDTSRWIGETRTLTEADFYGNVVVTGYGADHTQGAISAGMEGTYGEAINPDGLDFYGPWTKIYPAYNEEGSDAPTVGALNSQAARNVSGRSPVPVEVRIPDNSSIRLSEGLQLKHLVPGTRVPLLARLNTRPRNQMQKLDHLTVTETSEGEDVKVTLSPATRADSDEVTP
ncbi:minor tail protein [Microbacterium phage Mashley]|nr:minor tail protein [Microbacterium phage Mashley]